MYRLCVLISFFVLFISNMVYAQSSETISLPEGLQIISVGNAAQATELSINDAHDLELVEFTFEGDLADNSNWFRAIAIIASMAGLDGSAFNADYTAGAVPLIQDFMVLTDVEARNINRATKRINADYNDLSHIAISPDTSLIAVGDEDGLVALWDIENEEETINWQGYTDYINGMAFSTDGTSLITLGYDGNSSMIGEWSLTGELLSKIRNPLEGYSMRLNADGTMLAIGGETNISLWDVSTWEEIATMESPSPYIISMAFSPDGSILATGSEAGAIYLWDLSNAHLLGTLSGQLPDDDFARTVTFLDFSPDGILLLSTNRDGLLHLWGTTADAGTISQTSATETADDDSDNVTTPTETPTETVSDIPSESISCSVNAKSTVNLRSGPGTNFDLAGTLSATETTEADGQFQATDGFTWYRLSDGAWVRSDLVSASDCSNLAEVSP